MNKIVYIIPGYSESKDNNPAYKKIGKYFKSRNTKTIIVDIDWKNKTMAEYVSEFSNIYSRNDNNGRVYFLGFSFGAMIAFISAEKLRPTALILCSLSPFFKEDVPHIREWWKKLIGKKRLIEFKKLSFNSLAKNISSKTFIIAGGREGEEVARRAKDANKKIKNSKLTIIPDARHKIGQNEYLVEIEKIINFL